MNAVRNGPSPILAWNHMEPTRPALKGSLSPHEILPSAKGPRLEIAGNSPGPGTGCSLPETNSSHLPGSHPKRKPIIHPFSGAMLVSGRVGISHMYMCVGSTWTLSQSCSPKKEIFLRRAPILTVRRIGECFTMLYACRILTAECHIHKHYIYIYV